MHNENYYITDDNQRVELNPQYVNFPLYESNLKVLVIQGKVDEVFCWNNNLTELIVPEGTTGVYCFNNKLTKLVLPDSVVTLYCHNNNLTELITPKNLRYISCDYGLIGVDFKIKYPIIKDVILYI